MRRGAILNSAAGRSSEWQSNLIGSVRGELPKSVQLGSRDSDLDGLQHIQIAGLLRSEDFRGNTALIGFVGGAGAKRSQLVKVASPVCSRDDGLDQGYGARS